MSDTNTDWWNQGWEAFDAHTSRDVSQWTDDGGLCFDPYSITTAGAYWGTDFLKAIQNHTSNLLILRVTFITIWSRFVHFILKPLRLSPTFSYVLSGVLLGPVAETILTSKVFPSWIKSKSEDDADRQSDGLYDILFVMSRNTPFGNISQFGVMIFIFLTGVKMDPSMILTTGKKAMVIGIGGFFIPLVLSTLLVCYIRTIMGYPYSILRIIMHITSAQANTSFPVIACLLTELEILNSELGRLALSSAMLSDIGYRLIDITSTSVKFNISGEVISIYTILACIAFVILVVYVIRPTFIWVIRNTSEGRQVNEVYIISILVLVILSGLASIAIGQHVLFGPFILGLAVPEGPPLGLTLINRLEPYFTGLWVPLFLSASGLRMSLSDAYLGDHTFLYFNLIIFTLLVKLACVLFPALYCRIPFRDSLALALILCCKGVIEILVYNSWKDSLVIDNESFAVMIISAMVMAAIVPPMVKFLYDPARKYSGYIKRTIQDTRHNSELRIIVCIQEEESIPTTIRLIQVTNPTREDPIYVCLIHLVELLGRSAPLLISHDLWKTKSINESESQYIINAFQHFEKKYEGSLIVQPYTAISPTVTMHDDICSLALSKRAAFIIIPFHKQWAIDGTMGNDNLSIRTVNNNVLNRAPCSVGLLVDRGHLGQSAAMLLNESKYRVAMIFLGGEDDREGLALARRMANNRNVLLKVIRIIAANNAGVNQTQISLDEEALDEFKMDVAYNSERLVYKEEVVRDGEHLVSILVPIEDEHDLILVGRRYGVYSPATVGLTEWSECPELGVLGDLFASSDIKSPVSVLVVQQQIMGSMLVMK